MHNVVLLLDNTKSWKFLQYLLLPAPGDSHHLALGASVTEPTRNYHSLRTAQRVPCSVESGRVRVLHVFLGRGVY